MQSPDVSEVSAFNSRLVQIYDSNFSKVVTFEEEMNKASNFGKVTGIKALPNSGNP